MATTVLTSAVCETEEMAAASLNASITEYARGGHKVSVRETITQEVVGGWIASVIIEIEDLEEEEEEKPEEKKSEARASEELIEKENALFALTHLGRAAQAERAFPDAGDAPDTTQIPEDFYDRVYENEGVPADDTIGIDTNPEALSETFKNDFSEALNSDPVPPGLMPDSALPASTAPDMATPVQSLSEQELREEAERTRLRHEEVAAALAQKENPEGPILAPEE